MLDRHPLGKLAYDTYVEELQKAGEFGLYFAWDSLHSAHQNAYQKAAESIWLTAFQAGADSVVLAREVG